MPALPIVQGEGQHITIDIQRRSVFFKRLCQSEIQNLYRVISCDFHIGGLQMAMNNSALAGVFRLAMGSASSRGGAHPRREGSFARLLSA